MTKIVDRNENYLKSKAVIKSDRRSFIQKSIVGSLLLASTSTIAGQNLPINEVCSKFSYIDSLSIISERLADLKSNILFDFVIGLDRQLKLCQNRFSELKRLVDELEVEICNQKKPGQIQTFSEIVELGKVNAKVIQNTISEGDIKPYFIAVNLINQQIVSKAQECLPDSEITLSSKATAILKSIIKFINEEAEKISKESLDAQTQHSINAREVVKSFSEIDGFIDEANDLLVEGEDPFNDAQKSQTALKAAYKKIGYAILSLRKLLRYPKLNSNISDDVFSPLPEQNAKISEKNLTKVFDKNDNAELADVISISLELIREGILNQYNLTITNEVINKTSFVNALYKSNQTALLQNSTVEELLWKYCKPATPKRVAEIIAIVKMSTPTPLHTWNVLQIPLIKSNLESRFSCEKGGNKDKLAEELAQIF